MSPFEALNKIEVALARTLETLDIKERSDARIEALVIALNFAIGLIPEEKLPMWVELTTSELDKWVEEAQRRVA